MCMPLPRLHFYQYPSEQLRGGTGEVMLRCRYDMTRANLVDPELEKYVQRGLSLPDVVLVSCQRLCCCTPACRSLAAAAQHDSRAPHSIMLHGWVCSCGQLLHLLLGGTSPAVDCVNLVVQPPRSWASYPTAFPAA